jgi:hypothetical protein
MLLRPKAQATKAVAPAPAPAAAKTPAETGDTDGVARTTARRGTRRRRQ